MFESFPKKRKKLPTAYKKIHAQYYKRNREGKTFATFLSKKMESWMHVKVARASRGKDRDVPILEIGAGTLNHLPYEPDSTIYDIVEPFTDLYKSSNMIKRISSVYSDVKEIPETKKYGKIISIASFEHICNLPEVVAKSALLLTESGLLTVAIPSEGTILWKAGWKCTTGLEFMIKYGLDYGVLLEHEHVNTAHEIETTLQYFFENVVCNVFGLSRQLSLYQFFACSKPHINKCNTYLEKVSRSASLYKGNNINNGAPS